MLRMCGWQRYVRMHPEFFVEWVRLCICTYVRMYVCAFHVRMCSMYLCTYVMFLYEVMYVFRVCTYVLRYVRLYMCSSYV
jgi:hypothetical protein